MDPNELFKSFFGSSPMFGEFKYRGYGHSNDDVDQWSHGGSGEDIFGDFHKEFHKQMEEMDRQMREVFQVFRMSDFPSVPAVPYGQMQEQPSKKSPRDLMLKDGGRSPVISPPVHHEPVAESSSEAPSGILPSPPQDDLPSLFEKFFSVPRWNRMRPQDKQDTDLDDEVPDNSEIADLFKGGGESYTPLRKPLLRPFSFFGHNSVHIQTVVGTDGIVEERRTVRDSTGREEMTVTRRIGDSSHSVTTVTDENGRVEKQETFQNVDKDKLSDFDDHWKGQKTITHSDQDSQIPLKNTPYPFPTQPEKALSNDTHSIFRRLFGFNSK